MTDLLTATEGFMRGAKQSFAVLGDQPQDVFVQDLREMRVKILAEEHKEYLRGEGAGVREDGSVFWYGATDLTEIADGLCDQVVVAWGTLLAYFGPECAAELAAEVARSNLSKVDGSLGPVQLREDGKVLKPPGWRPPDIEGVLRRHGFLPTEGETA